jgi:DNA-directed RNA polymerase specialized sigma24 family protein
MAPRTQEVLSALPSLRRYARALTGERRRGDEYIRVALETLSQEPWRLGPDDDVKVQLYKLFHDVLGALSMFDPDASDGTDASDPYQRLKRDLLDLPLLNRKLLLLVALERFSLAEAARIVELPAHDVASRVAHARVQLKGLGTVTPRQRVQRAWEQRAS